LIKFRHFRQRPEKKQAHVFKGTIKSDKKLPHLRVWRQEASSSKELVPRIKKTPEFVTLRANRQNDNSGQVRVQAYHSPHPAPNVKITPL
jgi:hypothetical protein